MTKKRPATISEYIDTAPAKGKAHLSELYAILKGVTPKAEEAIKWGHPFFVEPRFLYAFAAYKAHIAFTSSNDALKGCREELQDFEITKMEILKIPYNKPIPQAVIQKVAKARLKLVKERKDDNFW